jgi:hypothetical protein
VILTHGHFIFSNRLPLLIYFLKCNFFLKKLHFDLKSTAIFSTSLLINLWGSAALAVHPVFDTDTIDINLYSRSI